MDMTEKMETAEAKAWYKTYQTRCSYLFYTGCHLPLTFIVPAASERVVVDGRTTVVAIPYLY